MRTAPGQMPSISMGWGDSFANTNLAKSFFYDLSTQLLYVMLPNIQFNVFINVPSSIARMFNYTRDPDSFYVNNINNYYHPCLLTSNCGILITHNGKYLIER